MRDAVVSKPNFAVEVVRDLSIGAPGGFEQLADIYLPQNVAGAPPVVIWIHGGGWRNGDRHSGPDFSRFFARRGFAMVSIEYRTSDEATFPAQIEDVRTAIRWVRSVAAQYGFDAGRIGLWGSSAGGHLAALAAVTDAGVQAVVDGYGPTDILLMDAQRDPERKPSSDTGSLSIPAGECSGDADSRESLLFGAPIYTIPDRVQAANPIPYVKPGAPPFLILHGTADAAVPDAQSVMLYEALAAAGNDVTLGLVEGLGHGFFSRNHLDDGEPRTISMRIHTSGAAEQQISRKSHIFAQIEAFFRTHLAV